MKTLWIALVSAAAFAAAASPAAADNRGFVRVATFAEINDDGVVAPSPSPRALARFVAQ